MKKIQLKKQNKKYSILSSKFPDINCVAIMAFKGEF